MDKKYIILFLIVLALILGTGTIFYFQSPKMQQSVKDDDQQAQPEVKDKSLLSWQEISSEIPWEGRDSHGFVVFKNKMWLMGGVDGKTRLVAPENVDYGNAPHFSDVWHSDDGINWELVVKKAPWKDRRSMQLVDFKNKIWLMGGWGPELGCKRDVWSSEDGAKWKLENSSAQWEAREGHQALVFKNKIWLMGGVNYSKHKVFNDVWSSDDGKNWTQATANSGWAPRWDFAISVYQNKLWLVGGMDLDGKLYKDVWSSEDGVRWTLVSANPPFLARQGFSLMDYKNSLWVVGRLNSAQDGSGPNDVWYTEDGINWTKTKNDPGWTGREDFAAVIFKDNIWVYGGMDKNWAWRNDVWHSTIQ